MTLVRVAPDGRQLVAITLDPPRGDVVRVRIAADEGERRRHDDRGDARAVVHPGVHASSISRSTRLGATIDTPAV
jgi:hypothetical protein